MQNRPLVSIIVRNYNYENFVGVAIDSALRQTYRQIETIVVDDGSTDNSRQVISNYGNKIASIFQENGGEESACCTGFQASNGEIVIYLDADDALKPEAIENVVAVWDSGVAKVQYYLDWIDATGHPLGMRWPKDGMPRGDVMRLIRTYGFYPSPPTTGNAFARWFLEKVLPTSNGPWLKGIDAYFIALAPLYGEVRSMDQSLGNYRVHGQNMSEVGGLMDLSRLRDRICIQRRSEEALREHAIRLGKPIRGALALNIPRHCKMRLFSLLIDRAGHPFSDDRTWLLVTAGIKSAWRYPHLSLRKRLLFTLTFPILPLFSGCWLHRNLQPLMDSRSRGGLMKRLVTRARHSEAKT